ncbi:MAG: hypothetical protein IJ279_02890 [Clostridia bacterium]|nr:hypothetical protein [Clostridia bacterium]
MKKFWAYISNGEYSVGTTGQTVYLYDKNGKETGKFKDMIYAYTPMFSPDGKIFVVKSTEGRLAVYSLKTCSLVKKFRFSKFAAAQDDGFCFSPDGKYFINIENHGDDGLLWAITVYDTEDFSMVSRKYLGDIAINYIEYDYETGEYYCIGCTPGVEDSNFVAKYKNNEITDIRKYPEKDWSFNMSCLLLKMHGFTEKQYEWSYLDRSLDEVKKMNFSIAKLYETYEP